jgi:hypothetical protein
MTFLQLDLSMTNQETRCSGGLEGARDHFVGMKTMFQIVDVVSHSNAVILTILHTDQQFGRFGYE